MIDTVDRKGCYVSSFFPGCFFFFGIFTSKSSGSGASRSQTASASLKNTIVPSTSIKQICSGSDVFSLDLPKRFFWRGSVVPSSVASYHLMIVSVWSVLPSVPAFPGIDGSTILCQVYSSCFFCVLKCHNRNSCLYTGSDYNRFFVLPPIPVIDFFSIMTVDNTSEKLLFYSISDVLSAADKPALC